MFLRPLIPLLAAVASFAAEADPDEAFAQSLRCERAGNYVGARAALAPLERRMSNDYLYQVRTAWLALCAADYQAAIAGYRAAQRIEPASLEPRLGLARAYLGSQHYAEADNAARQVLQADQYNYTAITLLASALRGEGHPDDAFREISILTERYPSDVSALAFAATLATESGQTEEAKTLRATLARLEPEQQKHQPIAIIQSSGR